MTFAPDSGMRLLASFVLFAGLAGAADLPYFSVLSEDAGAWPEILGSIGFQRQPAGVSRIFVARTGASASVEWPTRVEHGAILILEGESSLADLFGFRRGPGDPVRVQSLTDVHRPALPIVWEKGLELPVFGLPENAQVFARERWTGAPVIAGLKRGAGAVLWVAAPPGERGHERFPYLLNALADLGLAPALPQQPPLGFLRFRLPHARGPGLFRGALAQGRNRRPACCRLAQFRARPGRRRVPEKADRGLPSRGHPGLRLVRAAARQREVLGRPSRMARADRHAAGRATGLAQADEPDQSRLLPRR